MLYRPQEGLDGGGLSGRYEHTVVITKMAFDPYRLEREPVAVSKRANAL